MNVAIVKRLDSGLQNRTGGFNSRSRLIFCNFDGINKNILKIARAKNNFQSSPAFFVPTGDGTSGASYNVLKYVRICTYSLNNSDPI